MSVMAVYTIKYNGKKSAGGSVSALMIVIWLCLVAAGLQGGRDKLLKLYYVLVLFSNYFLVALASPHNQRHHKKRGSQSWIRTFRVCVTEMDCGPEPRWTGFNIAQKQSLHLCLIKAMRLTTATVPTALTATTQHHLLYCVDVCCSGCGVWVKPSSNCLWGTAGMNSSHPFYHHFHHQWGTHW